MPQVCKTGTDVCTRGPGALLKDEVTLIWTQMYDYIYNQVDTYIKFLPASVRKACVVAIIITDGQMRLLTL